MTEFRKIRKSIDGLVADKTKSSEKFVAMLGDHDGLVEVGNGLVYITLINNGQVMRVINRRADTPNVAGRYVEVGHADEKSTVLEVLGFRNVFANDTAPRVVRHGDETHGEFGSDRVPVGAGQFMPLITLPAGGLVVQIYGDRIAKTDSPGFVYVYSQPVDLSSYVPSSGALYVIIESDDDGVLSVEAGDIVASIDVLNDSHIPIPKSALISCVRLYDGQDKIRREKYVSDIIELRFTKSGALAAANKSYIDFKNQTGSDISGPALIMYDDTLGVSGVTLGKLAVTDGSVQSKYIIGICFTDVENGDDGRAYFFVERKGVDTTGTSQGETWQDGQIVYNDPATDGEFSNVEPSAPNLNLSLAVVKKAHTNGTLLVRIELGMTLEELHNVNGTAAEDGGMLYYDAVNGYWDVNNFAAKHFNYWNGSFLESHALSVKSDDGVTIEATLESSVAGDLTMRFSDGWSTLNCTPTIELLLTEGTDTVPVTNYIYVTKTSKTLTASTSGFPSEEHNRVGIITVRSATFVQSYGGLVARHNDHSGLTDDGRGHALHIAERLRKLFGNWVSGCESSLSIVTTSSPDDLFFSVTSGFVDQLHNQSFGSMDMSAGDFISVYNHPTTPLVTVTNFNGQLTDSEGNSLSGSYYTVVLWGVNSSGDQTDAVMANLPSGGYSNLSDALADVSKYTDYTIPANDAFRNTAFLIGAYTVKHSPAGGGSWTPENYENLRGTTPNTAAGAGGAGGVTSFLALLDVLELSYSGKSLQGLRANLGETGIEFDGINTSSHAGRHTDGSDDIQDATASQKGLATGTQIAKLDDIESEAEVNVNADWDATSGGAEILNKPTLPVGDVVGPSSSVVDRIAVFANTSGKLIKDGLKTIADLLNRSNHTGTQLASTISDFDAEVANNTSVAANTTHRELLNNPHAVTKSQIGLSNAEIKAAYEANADTNEFSDTEQTKLANARETLAATRIYYVSTTGSDSNDGLTPGSSFLTIQKAIDVSATIDLAGFNLTVQVADGTYAWAVRLKDIVGYSGLGSLTLKGNSTAPSSVLISTVGVSIQNASLQNWKIDGFKLTSSASVGLFVPIGEVTFYNMDFGACAAYQIYATANGTVVAGGNYAISGNAINHVNCEASNVRLLTRTITFSNSPAFTQFVYSGYTGKLYVNGMTFTNGATVTGMRYFVEVNALIFTAGGGANYLPGSVAGVVATGGQYV